MTNWSPPTFARPWLAITLAAYALVLGYSLVIAQQILLGVIVGFWILAVYLLWRVLVAFEAIADAAQRIADAKESN